MLIGVAEKFANFAARSENLITSTSRKEQRNAVLEWLTQKPLRQSGAFGKSGVDETVKSGNFEFVIRSKKFTSDEDTTLITNVQRTDIRSGKRRSFQMSTEYHYNDEEKTTCTTLYAETVKMNLDILHVYSKKERNEDERWIETTVMERSGAGKSNYKTETIITDERHMRAEEEKRPRNWNQMNGTYHLERSTMSYIRDGRLVIETIGYRKVAD